MNVQFKAKTDRRPIRLLSRLSLRGLLRREDGVTTLEFSLVAPTLMLLIMGTVEIGLAMYAQHVMEGATFAASRLGKTGYTEEGRSQEELIREILERRAGMLLDMDRVQLTSKAYQQFDQIGQPEPFIDANGNGERDVGENYTDVNGNGQYDSDMGADGYGNAEEVVVYTVTYPWPVFTPIIGHFIANQDGHVNLTARTVVRNEPY